MKKVGTRSPVFKVYGSTSSSKLVAKNKVVSLVLNDGSKQKPYS